MATDFEYLLNAMECASAEQNPAEHDYRAKRTAVLAHVSALEAERDQLRDVLWRGGFVMCDIPACNCGSWHHKYGLPERFREIADVLAEAGHELCNENGNLPIRALKSLAAERDQLRAELAEYRQDAKRYRYLRNNMSFYDVDHDFDVEGRNVPVLASVSECIWYHATDCLLRKLDEVVDAALAADGEAK